MQKKSSFTIGSERRRSTAQVHTCMHSVREQICTAAPNSAWLSLRCHRSRAASVLIWMGLEMLEVLGRLCLPIFSSQDEFGRANGMDSRPCGGLRSAKLLSTSKEGAYAELGSNIPSP